MRNTGSYEMNTVIFVFGLFRLIRIDLPIKFEGEVSGGIDLAY